MGVPCPPVSSTRVSSSRLSRALCRIWAVQMTTSLRFTAWPKKHLWLLSPLMAVTLKEPCRTWNSSLACCSTRCTYTQRPHQLPAGTTGALPSRPVISQGSGNGDPGATLLTSTATLPSRRLSRCFQQTWTAARVLPAPVGSQTMQLRPRRAGATASCWYPRSSMGSAGGTGRKQNAGETPLGHGVGLGRTAEWVLG